MLRIIKLLFLLSLVSNIEAQKKIDNFINTFDGLSENNISAILQDKYGFMWFATKNGLCRFDGYSYKTYVNNPSDTNSISFNWVTDIAQDDDGNLWLATFGGGLNYFDRRREMFIRYVKIENNPKSISNNTILKLFIDNDKNLWVGTEEGLNFYRKGSNDFIRYTVSNSKITSNYVSSLTEDDDGNLWIGTMGGGLCILNKKLLKFSNYKNQSNDANSLSDNNIRCITKDSRGNIWIGTLQSGLNQAIVDESGKISFKRFAHQSGNSNSLANNSVLTIFEDSKKNLWIGTENGGVDLFIRSKNVFLHHTNITDDESSIASNSIWSICEDSGGSLWFGTFNKGVSKWDPNRDKFLHYALKPRNNKDILSSTVTSFYEVSPRNIIIGTDGTGYFIWDAAKQSFTQFTENRSNPSAISGNVILAMAADSKNKLWMGTWGNGINISKSNVSNNSFEKVFTYENVFSILKDNANTIWVGTWGVGLHIIQDGWQKVYQYTPSDSDKLSISSGNIFCIMQDSYKKVWIGTLYGLNLVSGGFNSRFTFKKYFHQNNDTSTISSNTILSLYEDSHRNLWIGSGFGLNRFDAKAEKFVRINNPLLMNKEIKAILEDANGKLWLSTDNNLISYNPRDNKALSYDKSDGISTRGFSVGACLKTSDNYFLFGGKNGFVKFHPDSVKSNSFIPPVHIVDFKVFNKSIIPDSDGQLDENIMFTDEIELSPKQSVFSIEFVALNYSHPEKNQYAYMLEGLEKEWNYVGSQRFASYSNLDPGEYTFLVKASNNDNVWNETPVRLKIIVKPPFWKSIWFKLILGLLFIWAIYSFYVARVKKIRKQLELQEKLFQSKKVESEKEIIKLQKDKLDSELEYTNKELASTTMNIMQKNEKMISLRDQLLELIPTTDNNTQRKLKQITKDIDDDLENENKWDRFESNFDQIHDNFIKRFTDKFPKVTHKDLKMCAFIRMNLSNKEIANLLNITLRSVESSRYRIRKKMELDSEINLNDFIMRF